VFNYSAMHALAKAIAWAGTVENVRAIRAALPRAFPMLGDQFPAEIYGIGADGRMHTPAAIQELSRQGWIEPEYYVWWAGSRGEFSRIKEMSRSQLRLKRVRADLDS